jgi:3-oxoacyl-[acyl-carrier-protein] synthase-1
VEHSPTCQQPVAITATGLVTSVGLTASGSCAAMRAGLANPIETRFLDARGEWVMGHSVPLAEPWCDIRKHVKMAAMAIEEALEGICTDEWSDIPVVLCLAEADRPGRLEGLDQRLLDQLHIELGERFSRSSIIVAHGRVSVAVALHEARKLLYEKHSLRVLIAAVDTLLLSPTVSVYDGDDRLLTKRNSNGFMPGEGAGAVLVTKPSGGAELLCTGLGFGIEHAVVTSDDPLRADGLTEAITRALAEASCQMHDLDFRIADISGEQYYFKEATLALARTLRRTKEEFDLWHPADSIGETGAAAGVAVIAAARAACLKAYAPGNRLLIHLANDNGLRAAAVLRFEKH